MRHAQPTPSTGPLAASAALAVGLLSVFVLDQASGSAPVQHLYYVFIVLAAIRFGFAGGIAASLVAIVLYHVANPRLLAFQHQQWDFVQVLLFVAVGLVTARLVDDNRRLDLLARTDDLTGLHNLRSFEQRLRAMFRACRAANEPLAMLVLDVDRLKTLNDTHGHLAGAEAVRTVGRVIAARLPAGAAACRYGGDEFVVALPRYDAAEGQVFADALRAAVQAEAPDLAGISFPAGTLSVSIGVACQRFGLRWTPPDLSEAGERLFRAADRALYRAKELGRNQVSVAGPGTVHDEDSGQRCASL
ncbi:MAG TPA: diguanylate cyclase [Vicinamibacterales bacterium]|nr:diguanylate cyclase [Vicinamibacterales bacterium]